MDGENKTKTKRRDWMDVPLLRSRINSANVKIFPEAGFGYFIGPFLALVSNAVFGGYLNRYYTDVMGLTKWANGFAIWMPILSVIAVISGNFLVGRLMDKFKTSQGKARPLLLLSAPLLAIAICLLFLAPQKAEADGSSMITLVWIAVSYNLYYSISYPFYYVSHSAFVSLSTRNSKHRSLLAVFSNAAAIAAVGFGCNIVFPLFQGLLFKTDSATSAVDAASSYVAWRYFMIGLVAITFVGIVIEYYFTRERISEENSQSGDVEKKISMARQAKACFSDKYWVIIIVFFFLFQLSGLFKNTSMVYYCRWMFLKEGDPNPELTAGGFQSILALVGGIPTGIGMILAWPLANKIGKGRSMGVGLFFSALGGLVSIVAPHNFYLVTAGVVLKGIGSIPAMYVSLALMSDVLDHLEAKNGFRSDGFTMSVYGSIMVGLTGLAIGILNALLSATGYDAQSTSQNQATQTVLVWCYLGAELVAYAICAVMFLFMDVEKFSELDHKAILEDQKAKALDAGEQWIPPEERLRQQQEAFDAEAEKNRQVELHTYCEKKALDYEQEEAKYQQIQQKKIQKAAAQKAASEAKQVRKATIVEAKRRKKEECRKQKLRHFCEKRGLDYETEDKNFQQKQALKKAVAEAAEKARAERIKHEFDQMRQKARP
jgi:glycoside/pentoside/hexuronide:cation symporter, GPH family